MNPDNAVVVVLAEFLSPESNSTGDYFYQILKRLLENGSQVQVITPKSQLNQEACETLSKEYGACFSVRFVKDYGNYSGSGLRKGIFSFLSTLQFYREVRKLLLKRAILFFGTNPSFLLLLIALGVRNRKVQTVMLCYDLFPENLISISQNIVVHLIGRGLKPFFNHAYRKLDKVLVIGRCMSERVISLGVAAEKISIVTNWADGDEIRPFAYQRSVECKVHFQFFGNIGRLQGVEKLLECFEYVTSSNAHFSFIGSGVCADKVKGFIQSNTTKVSVDYQERVPRKDRNLILNSCDVSIVSLDHRVTGLGVPSKAYYSLAAGKPLFVMANQDCETSCLVEEHKLGWLVSDTAPVDIAAKIDEICEAVELIPSSEYVRGVFDAHYSKEIGTTLICNEITSMGGG